MPDWVPTLSDLTSGDIGSIMRQMGYEDQDITKYSEYFQDYDPYKSEFAQERYGFEMEGIGLKEAGIGIEQSLTQDLYGLGQVALDKKLGQTYETGESQMYDIFAQGDTLASGGLGDRSRFGKRAKKGVMSGTYGAMENINLEQQEQDIRYGSAMQGFNVQRQGLGLEKSLADLDMRTVIAESERDYEDEFWDFLTMLGIEFDVDTDPTNNDQP